MNIVSILKNAILEQDWIQVQEAYSLLGGEILVQTPVEDSSIDQRTLNAVYEGSGEEPPKKRRGRPKKAILAAIPQQSIPNPPQDPFKMVRNQPTIKDEKGSPAKMEPFRLPEGPNKFDPKTTVEESDLAYNRVNDKVTRTPRTRGTVVQNRDVFCKDCSLTVSIPSHSSMNLELGRCEYAAVGKRESCPYFSQCSR